MKFYIPRQLDKELRKEKSLIDHSVIIASIISPLATIPQAVTIWQGDVEGVSIVMWIIFLLCSVVTVSYTILHRLRSLYLAQAAWVLMEVIILFGLYVNS